MPPRAIRTIDYRLGESISLDDLRTVVDETREVDGGSVVSIEVEAGQRDAQYYHLIIREP